MKTLLVALAIIVAMALPEMIVNALPNWALDVLGYGLLLGAVAGAIYLMAKIMKGNF